MLKSYIKILLRNMIKQKSHAAITVLGLTVGPKPYYILLEVWDPRSNASGGGSNQRYAITYNNSIAILFDSALTKCRIPVRM